MSLTDDELRLLRDTLESDRVERKESLSDLERVRQAACAFSNDLAGNSAPGVVFIGLTDEAKCANLVVEDSLVKRTADVRLDGSIVPTPSMLVEKRTLDGCDLLVLTVFPASAPPVRLRGVVWVRVGSSRARATPEEERRLNERRRGHDLPYELQPMTSATLEDLDLDAFRSTYLPAAVDPDVLAENRRSLEDQLRSARFCDSRSVPTSLGILVVGKDPQSYIPGAWIQFLRLAGRELADQILDQKTITGPIATQLRRIDEVVTAHVRIPTSVTAGPTEVRRPDYPVAALQQLLRNAVMHRTYEGTAAPVRVTWYEDRIEIHSPGGPYGQVNEANFGAPGATDYRNLHLAGALRDLGFVQRFGVGIATARRELELNGNPPLEYVVTATSVLAVVRVRP